MAGAAGQYDWKSIAAANGIEDPLRLSPGQLIDLNASAGAGASFSAGVDIAAPTIAAPQISVSTSLGIN